MTDKGPRRFEVSIRGKTFERLRAYARSHNVQIRSVIDDLIMKGLDEAEKTHK